MNSGDINDVINNLCNKLGTTVSTLIPEFSKYMIAKESIWIIFAAICLIVCLGIEIHVLKMRRYDGAYIKVYKNTVDDLGDVTNEPPNSFDSKKEHRLWRELYHSNRICYYDSDDYWMYRAFAIVCGGIGLIILCITVPHIIGWSIAPYARFVEWMLNKIAIGG